MEVGDVGLVLAADGSGEVALVCIVPAEGVAAACTVLAQRDSPRGHGHAVEHTRPGKDGERIRGRIVLLEHLEHLIEVIKGLRCPEVVLLQQVLAQDQAAIIEGNIKESGQIVAFAILQLERIHIVLKAELLDPGVEIGCPFAVVADRDNRTVECKGCILALGRLVENDIRGIGAGIQRQGNLGLVVSNRDDLEVNLCVHPFLDLGDRQPILLERQGCIV
ncbi:hypothetical protein SDC9_123605 [bioreactor metagenome]|uniref:Uncharacterized protein n=1 Tax=bioreactor metagenome TaxID=1076179 RepID=A0A645CI29_9ZZZZ